MRAVGELAKPDVRHLESAAEADRRVAKMYHDHGIRQPQIAQQLHLSQAKVSRLLQRAQNSGIVRVTVHAPLGGFFELEEALIQKHDLADAVVAETTSDDEAELLATIGAAGAAYLSDVLLGHERIGIIVERNASCDGQPHA